MDKVNRHAKRQQKYRKRKASQTEWLKDQVSALTERLAEAEHQLEELKVRHNTASAELERQSIQREYLQECRSRNVYRLAKWNRWCNARRNQVIELGHIPAPPPSPALRAHALDWCLLTPPHVADY